MSRGRVAFMLSSTAAIVLLVAAAVFADVTPRDNLFRNLSIFTEVFTIVRDSYVETVPSGQLVDGAFSGITDAIDEFSYYIPPAAMESWKETGRDETPRGAAISRRFGYGYVISVLPGSPAETAGIRSGDLIESVEGKTTSTMSAWQIRDAIARPRGAVAVAVLRDGEAERVMLHVPAGNEFSSEPELAEENGIPVISIPVFTDTTAVQVAELLNRLRDEETLIVDVRESAIGSVEGAVETADLFLESGTITELTGRKVDEQRWSADPQHLYGGRVLVLVDSTSAGAAEVFAGALQGNKRATLVGRPTYGRAIVQQLVSLPSGGGLWMTVGHYSGPAEKYTGVSGLRPDENVDLAPLLLDLDTPRDQRPDLILRKAVEMAEKPADTARAA